MQSFNKCTERERRIIRLVAEGLKNKDVAAITGTTEHVIKNYLRVIYDKLGVWSRLELALWYESRLPVDKANFQCQACFTSQNWTETLSREPFCGLSI